MNSSWLFDLRLYACVLVVSLPLLLAGESQHTAPSKSSSVDVPSSSARRRAAVLRRSDNDQRDAVGRHLAQNGAGGGGSLRLIINTGGRADAKRQRFTPWGGKRTPDDTGAVVWKRSKFQPWGGKRRARTAAAPTYANSRMSAYLDDSKREFHPWGGKRSI